MRNFLFPVMTSILVVAGATVLGGLQVGFIVAMLSVMEISLSFDNAVVNATVLRDMSEKWQRRFLTWGILIAVFGMRLIFPILIVAIAAGLSVPQTLLLAINDQDSFAEHIHSAHNAISAFGGMFLMMVFLKFLFDEEKETHWIHWLETTTSRWGGKEAVELCFCMAALLLLAHFLPLPAALSALTGGLFGLVLFVSVELICDWLEGHKPVCAVTGTAAKIGFSGFLYLEALDASFSFDGVIGAFAVSHNILIIMAGLGVGALFIRALTIYLVKQGTLNSYIYLEHGAHYGIGALAGIMLVSLFVRVPEVVTGLVGFSFILLSFFSSLQHNRRMK